MERQQIHDWVELWRPHVAAPSAMLTITGATIGGAPLWLLGALFVWGLLVHITGFTHNNLMDRAYDRQKGATWNTIARGGIAAEDAQQFFYAMLIFAVLLGMALAGGNGFWALAAMLLALATGFTYNFTSKTSRWAGLLMGTYVTALCLFGYYVAGGAGPTLNIQGQSTPYIWLLLVAVFSYGAISVLVDGGWKDADQLAATLGFRREVDPENPQRGRNHLTKEFLLFAFGLKFIPLLIGVAALHWSGWDRDPLVWVIWMALVFAYAGSLYMYLCQRVYDRPKMLRYLAGNNVLTYVIVMVAMAPAWGWWTSVIYTLIPLVWFVGMNVAIHGRVIAPNV